MLTRHQFDTGVDLDDKLGDESGSVYKAPAEAAMKWTNGGPSFSIYANGETETEPSFSFYKFQEAVLTRGIPIDSTSTTTTTLKKERPQKINYSRSPLWSEGVGSISCSHSQERERERESRSGKNHHKPSVKFSTCVERNLTGRKAESWLSYERRRLKPKVGCKWCLMHTLLTVLMVLVVKAVTTVSALAAPKLNDDDVITPSASMAEIAEATLDGAIATTPGLENRFEAIAVYLTETLSILSLEDLEDPVSPQSKAVMWLAHDDPARFSIPSSKSLKSVEERMLDETKTFSLVQRYALVVLWFALGGSVIDSSKQNNYDVYNNNNSDQGLASQTYWYNFVSHDKHECSWYDDGDGDGDAESTVVDHGLYGVTCDDLHQIRRITLPYLNLAGSLPSEIQHLSTLNYLNLRRNSLTGSIPDQLQELVHLTHLDLSHNNLNGTADIIYWPRHTLTRLEVLNLSNNKLDMLHHPSFETSKRHLNIGSGIGETRLRMLGLGNNLPTFKKDNSIKRETVTIPVGIRYLTTLTQLSLRGSSLGGTLPAWIFRELPLLKFMDVSHNELEGSFGAVSSLPQNLRSLLLHDNHLTGTLPEAIVQLPDLAHVSIHNTNMTMGTSAANLICWDDETTAWTANFPKTVSTCCKDPTCPCCHKVCCDADNDCHGGDEVIEWHSISGSSVLLEHGN